MIKKFLRNIRQKPKHVRDRVALSIALSFTLFILIIWIYNAPSRHAAILSETEIVDDSEDSPGFFDSLGAIGEKISEIKDTISTSTKDTTEDGKTAEEIIAELIASTTRASTTMKSETESSSFNFTTSTPKQTGSAQKEVRIETVQTATSSDAQASPEE